MDWNNRVEAFALVDRAVRLQLAGVDGPLSKIEECLTRALELDPESIEGLQEAAHLYDAVIRDPEKATNMLRDVGERLLRSPLRWTKSWLMLDSY